MKKPKIVLISETYKPDLCGVADYIEILSQSLTSHYDVYVITRRDSERKVYIKENVKIFEVLESKLYIFDLIKILKEIQPDVVDIQLSYSGASKLNRKNLFNTLNALFIKRTIKCKLYCTVHELSALHPSPSKLKMLYRKIRDYLNTRGYDFYFCVDKHYIPYFKKDKAIFLEHFSNLPTFNENKSVTTKSFIYFGTLNHHKRIDKLLSIFKELMDKDPEYRLHIVGGVADDYVTEFNKLKSSFNNGIEYHGKLDLAKLSSIIETCSFAIFPFKVSDKNASVLGMLVNGLQVFTESDQKTEFDEWENYYTREELNAAYIHQITTFTKGKKVNFINNQDLINSNVEKRIHYYECL